MLVEDLTPDEVALIIKKRKLSLGTPLEVVLPREHFMIVRRRHGFTITGLARILGVDPMTVLKIEQGKLTDLSRLQRYWEGKCDTTRR